ncbi:MAG: metallophosphoesterase [Lysobacterales bacterium]|jgi:Icc protein
MPRSATTLRVIQVSDCHVSADPQTTYRGTRADRNLRSLLPALRRWQPDLILLTGDVSEDASAAAYGRVSALLDTVGATVLALPGNHDDGAVMQRYFPSGPWTGLYERGARRWNIILLDSTVPGEISGLLREDTLERLETSLRRQAGAPALIALHHQPVPVNSPWIDRYALEEPGPFLDILDRFPSVRCVTWGHVHQAFESERNGVALLSGPSTAANSLPNARAFTADMSGPACRWLELDVNGEMRTGLLHA